MDAIHHDTHGITGNSYLSIPLVSHRKRTRHYYSKMPAQTDTWKNWGTRYRQHCKDKGTSLRKVSELMGLAESTLRSWTNGNREVNLSDFVRLCLYAEADPSQILLGKMAITTEKRQEIGELVARILEADPTVNPGYAETMSGIRSDLKKKIKKEGKPKPVRRM